MRFAAAIRLLVKSDAVPCAACGFFGAGRCVILADSACKDNGVAPAERVDF